MAFSYDKCKLEERLKNLKRIKRRHESEVSKVQFDIDVTLKKLAELKKK